MKRLMQLTAQLFEELFFSRADTECHDYLCIMSTLSDCLIPLCPAISS